MPLDAIERLAAAAYAPKCRKVLETVKKTFGFPRKSTIFRRWSDDLMLLEWLCLVSFASLEQFYKRLFMGIL